MGANARFTKQESRVVELLLQGKSNKQIAAQLGIQVRTAEFHLKNIYAKLNVASRTEAVLKLAGERPRESTGFEPEAVNHRQSTVVKTDGIAKNRQSGFLARVRNMPTVFYGSIAAALVLISLGYWGFASGALYFLAPTASVMSTAITPSLTATPAPSPTMTSTPTLAPAASDTPVVMSASPTPAGDSCSGAMPVTLAGPKINVTLVNNTQGNTTVSVYLAKNRFGDCGYRSYELTWGASLPLKDVLPYGCYSLYALINDPNNPTHVTTGPVCITSPDPLVFRITYSRIVVTPGT